MDGITPKDIDNIRKGYVLAQELEQQIARAKECGFDCDELDQRCQQAKLTCERIIKTYGPAFPMMRE